MACLVHTILRSKPLLFLACLALAPLSGCSNSEEDSLATGLSDEGLCADTCPKVCGEDTDCDTGSGELCCDFGGEGTACVKASRCPRFCESDTECDSSIGQACVRVTFDSKKKICAKPQQAIKVCSGDNSCDTARGETCCSAFKEPICYPASMCPKTCAQSSECNTSAGETCCTTYGDTYDWIAAEGICLNASYTPCPKTCQSSTDCNTGKGELCCEGICSTHCSKSCTASDQCSGQLCCKTKAAQSVWFAFAGGVGGPNPGGSYNDNPGSPVTHDLCQLANEKLASCSSEISWDGQDCDEASTCAAQCIMDASCQEILDVSYYGSYNSFFACLEDCSY